MLNVRVLLYAFTLLVLFCFVVADCQDILVDVDNVERRDLVNVYGA